MLTHQIDVEIFIESTHIEAYLSKSIDQNDLFLLWPEIEPYLDSSCQKLKTSRCGRL